MVTVNLSGGLIVYKEVIQKNNKDYFYMIVRTRKKKGGQTNFYPLIKPLRYNKFFVKRLLRLEVGDIISLRGELGFINVREPFEELTPPYVIIKKMIIFIKEVEWDRHIDIRETKINTFINIIDDSYLKSLSNSEVEQMEEILDKKLLE